MQEEADPKETKQVSNDILLQIRRVNPRMVAPGRQHPGVRRVIPLDSRWSRKGQYMTLSAISNTTTMRATHWTNAKSRSLVKILIVDGLCETPYSAWRFQKWTWGGRVWLGEERQLFDPTRGETLGPVSVRTGAFLSFMLSRTAQTKRRPKPRD